MSQSGCQLSDRIASQKCSGVGLAGCLCSFIPASSGVLQSFRRLHGRHAVTQLSHVVPPPRAWGWTWSMVMLCQPSLVPQYWHFQPSRLNSTFLRKRGGFQRLLTRVKTRSVAGTRIFVEGEHQTSSHSDGTPVSKLTTTSALPL